MDSEKLIGSRSHYKVVELSTVTDETIEEALNRWTRDGWLFDQIQFVVRDSSRRPSMAFMFFTKPASADQEVLYDVHRSETSRSRDESCCGDNHEEYRDETDIS